jgi:hypothetical protein
MSVFIHRFGVDLSDFPRTLRSGRFLCKIEIEPENLTRLEESVFDRETRHFACFRGLHFSFRPLKQISLAFLPSKSLDFEKQKFYTRPTKTKIKTSACFQISRFWHAKATFLLTRKANRYMLISR